jgi:thymidylate kinase
MKQVYYIAGPDGSGKTTYLTEFEKWLNNRGKDTQRIWIRSPKILSKPLMAYCRLVGLTKYRTIDGIRYCKRQQYKSKFVSWLFPILQLLDFKIKWALIRYRSNSRSSILFDRFSLDTLADLMVDTKKYNLHKTSIGKEFVRMIPAKSKIVFLSVEESEIRNRKPDTLYDEHLNDKILVYKILSHDLGIKVIDNNKDFETVKLEIFNYLNG